MKSSIPVPAMMEEDDDDEFDKGVENLAKQIADEVDSALSSSVEAQKESCYSCHQPLHTGNRHGKVLDMCVSCVPRAINLSLGCQPTAVPATEKAKAAENRAVRQKKVGEWAIKAFGEKEALSLPQRGIRLHEEATEAAQAAGVTREMAHKMVDYVFNRPVGELEQELGGVGVTALALAYAANINADLAEFCEVNRVLSKPLEHFTKRNAAKNEAGFLAAAPTTESKPASPEVEDLLVKDGNRLVNFDGKDVYVPYTVAPEINRRILEAGRREFLRGRESMKEEAAQEVERNLDPVFHLIAVNIRNIKS